MKNALLSVILTGIIALPATAQERFPSLLFNNTSVHKSTHHISGRHVDRSQLKDLDLRKTSGSTGSWYDYPDTVIGTTETIGLNTVPMWQDTAAIFGSSGGSYTGYGIPSFGYCYSTSVGAIFDPMDSAWAAYGDFISPSSGFTIDSVMVTGIYGRPVGPTYTDSLKLTFLYGNGDTTSNLPFFYTDGPGLWSWTGLSGTADTAFWWPDMRWDTAQNTSTNNTGVSIAPITYTFPLGPADTSVTYAFTRSYPVNIVVPPGNFAAMSISFISGAPTFPVFPATDTVEYADGSFKYGDFQPLFAGWGSMTFPYPPVSGPSYPWPLAITDDFTTGFFKFEGANDGNGWSPYYIPNWAFDADAGSGYYQQYPYVYFHAYSSLSTKTSTINNPLSQVKAYPNPAHDEVTIAFSLSAPASVSVSFTNVLGQVVSEQQMGVVTTGNAVMNTSALPAGVYFYTVTANGRRNTGKVLVAH